ncbi:hypothetical protein EC841_1011174 [Raoultella ornithinolytica]|jgi:hypothetical protein|uniref:Uncharacterized protein n=1 Tax=Raoultella ornithinolytica TaxID=54291 RepID=A0ABD7QRF1_RAOOR|nr:hypothetical protein EC841_1011174 [Raoultella ornithinolytica]
MIIISNTCQCKLFFEPTVVLHASQRVGLCRCYLDWENERETLVAAGVNRLYLLFAANLQASPVTVMDSAGIWLQAK